VETEPLPAPLAALLRHCRAKAGQRRQAIYEMKFKAATAPTPNAVAYWKRRVNEARAKPGQWQGWTTALYRVSVGKPADRDELRGILKHCVRQLRRAQRDETRAAPGYAVAKRARRVKWEMRSRGVEEVLAGMAA
jgi:hypothetical protein